MAESTLTSLANRWLKENPKLYVLVAKENGVALTKRQAITFRTISPNGLCNTNYITLPVHLTGRANKLMLENEEGDSVGAVIDEFTLRVVKAGRSFGQGDTTRVLMATDIVEFVPGDITLEWDEKENGYGS